MSDPLIGEIDIANPAPVEPYREPGLYFTTHHVDLPTGGQITGMDRADAIRIASTLSTRAYEARAVLVPWNGLVLVEPLRRIV